MIKGTGILSYSNHNGKLELVSHELKIENMAQTSDEILEKYNQKSTQDSYPSFYYATEDVKKAMIEFGNICAQRALQEASEKVFYTSSRDKYRNITAVEINKESILGAYPIENIK
jgi:hypothetical protein